jgi:hypothetical protein
MRPTIEQIKQHPWFSDVNWTAMEEMRVIPPKLGYGWLQEETPMTVEAGF